jgi:rubrerythrin
VQVEACPRVRRRTSHSPPPSCLHPQAAQNPTNAQLAANDLVALNYALTLERLEAAYYNTFQPVYSAANFTSAFGSAGAGIRSYFDLIRAHENAHVDTLVSAITARGGTAVPACAYTFAGVTNVTQYVQVAAVLENTGVKAYDGAINTINDKGLQTVAATIATVEARHAAYLNLIANGTAVGAMDGVPFPAAFDEAVAPTAIVAAVSPFIVSCPYNITTPRVLTVDPSRTSGSGARGLAASLAVTAAAVMAAVATSTRHHVA